MSYLNYNATFLKLSDVASWLEYPHQSGIQEFFIKPNTDTKQFAGCTITPDNFMSWYQNMKRIGYLETDDFEVLIASPKHTGMEFRIVMVDGKSIECSIYKQYQIVKSERFYDSELFETAEMFAKIHNPADVFVMDIAKTADGLKVIEYNTFNSAGLYDCNVSNIIDTINRYIET
jgi:hypothetical protein